MQCQRKTCHAESQYQNLAMIKFSVKIMVYLLEFSAQGHGMPKFSTRTDLYNLLTY